MEGRFPLKIGGFIRKDSSICIFSHLSMCCSCFDSCPGSDHLRKDRKRSGLNLGRPEPQANLMQVCGRRPKLDVSDIWSRDQLPHVFFVSEKTVTLRLISNQPGRLVTNHKCGWVDYHFTMASNHIKPIPEKWDLPYFTTPLCFVKG